MKSEKELKSKLKQLKLLARDFPGFAAAQGEILHLEMMQQLPKGTEYFFSDLHGEAGAFIHLLRSASGTVRHKIHLLYDNLLSDEEQNQLANLVYDPDRVIEILQNEGRIHTDWLRISCYRLVELLKFASSKYPRTRVAEKMPAEYAAIINELLYNSNIPEDDNLHSAAALRAVIDSDYSLRFIRKICLMIQNICVDQLHIIGDIFDRGPGAHHIMEELMTYPDVDIQWGNHDVVWMGAASGSEVCMANVVRVAISYNGFDCLEDGYGINLRPLYSFASEVYANDPCQRFTPKMLDENMYDRVDQLIAAKMHKAIAIIQFKLEGQLLKRHPEYGMAQRIVLEALDLDSSVWRDQGREWPLLDSNFPTVDPTDPLRLSPEEENVMLALRASFAHGEAMRRHMNYLFNIGSSYSVVNNNLLFHGCIPMSETGEFASANYLDRPLQGKKLMDETFRMVRKAWFSKQGSKEQLNASDLLYYLWCGPQSPMFGKSKMATFENYFIGDKQACHEVYNPYFQLSQKEEVCRRILQEFDLDPDSAHIINGHVPVKIKDGETPVKANGRLFVIDGGISKAYQPRTGIAGYTMIYNSHSLALVEHKRFADIENDKGSYMPEIKIIENMPQRVKLKDTSKGREICERIEDLNDLISAYEYGLLCSIEHSRA